MINGSESSPFSDGFEEFPPDDDRPIGLDIVRAPAKGSFVGVILSDRSMGKYTHWYRGRTSPCDGDDCTACSQAVERRWHAWLVVYSQSTRRQFILEVPAAASHELAILRKRENSLRGFAIKVERNNGKVNGRVRLHVSTKREDVSLLPTCPDVFEILSRMWNSRLSQSGSLETGGTLEVYREDDEQGRSTSA